MLLSALKEATAVAHSKLGASFSGFASIALACHGPPSAYGLNQPNSPFEWEVAAQIVLHDDKELLDPSNPVRLLMLALGGAVRDKVLQPCTHAHIPTCNYTRSCA